MCLGEIGLVESVDGAVALVRTDRGVQDASLLLLPTVAVGDHVVVHSGHVLFVVTEDEAAAAAGLRSGDVPPPTTPITSPRPMTVAGG